MASTRYKVNFFNNGSQPGAVMFFQRNPSSPANPFAVAWFTKYAYPQGRVTFEWTTDLSFVWSDTGELVPGIVTSASQSIPADLQSINQITLTYGQGFHFIDQRPGGQPGALTIVADQTIPPGMASVGIGMSGQPTFLAPAQPNMTTVFTPHPEYWIAFGTYVTGQVLQITEIGTPAQIVFPGNIYAMDATLNADGSWTIHPTHLAAEV